MKVIPIQDNHTFISNFIRAEAMDPDRKQTWLQYKAKLAEVRKRITNGWKTDTYWLFTYMDTLLLKFAHLRSQDLKM